MNREYLGVGSQSGKGGEKTREGGGKAREGGGVQ